MSKILVSFIRLWGRYEATRFTETDIKISDELRSYEDDEMEVLLSEWEEEYEYHIEEGMDIADFIDTKVNALIKGE